MSAVIAILIKIADWLGTYLKDIAKWFGNWFKLVWIGITALAGVIYAVIAQASGLINAMVNAWTEVRQNKTEFPTDYLALTEFVNSIIPLKELVNGILLLWALKMAAMVYRFIKSWIPTLT